MSAADVESSGVPHQPDTQTHKLLGFTLSAPSGTDVWRKPPDKHAFSCPTNLYPSYPLRHFYRARLSFKGSWEREYDQGGIILLLGRKDPPPSSTAGGAHLSAVNEEGRHHSRAPSVALPSVATGRDHAGGAARAAADAAKNKWIKAGVEFSHGRPWVSTVGCDRWADWSMYPYGEPGEPAKACTIEFRREAKESGTALWVYAVEVDDDGNKISERPVRELCWVFADEAEGEEDGWTVRVGAYVCRPSKVEGETPEDTLQVQFWGMEMERTH